MLPFLLVVAVLVRAADSTGAMAPGISRELATRRAAQISGVRYELHLDLTGRDTAHGRVRISFLKRDTGDVILDFRGPWTSLAIVNGDTARGVENNGAHLRIPAHYLRRGRNDVALAFTARMAPAGASIIRFHDETDGNEYLYTLLVPSDAHALFPCFDQPDLKARLTLTLVVPRGWLAIANGSSAADDPVSDRTTRRFAETEPLPTYLFAFAAGPYATLGAGARGTPFLARASRAKEVEADSLQNQVGSALVSLADYLLSRDR